MVSPHQPKFNLITVLCFQKSIINALIQKRTILVYIPVKDETVILSLSGMAFFTGLQAEKRAIEMIANFCRDFIINCLSDYFFVFP